METSLFSFPRQARHCRAEKLVTHRCAFAWWMAAFSAMTSAWAQAVAPVPTDPTAAEHVTLQAAIDANPGRMIAAPGGDYVIGQALRITVDGTGLCGAGTIIQHNPDANIIEVAGAADVRIHGLTLTRAEGHRETARHAVHAENCTGFELDGVRVLDNRSTAGTVYLERCRTSSVRGCTVRNYKRIGVDDRTSSDLYGYAFRVIDGTGILVTRSQGIQIQNNRIVEANIFPTRAVKEQHRLGEFVDGKNPLKKGPLAPPGSYANNWHQGSAIVLTSPEETRHVAVTGNYVENAAQGIDIHADHVTCSFNTVTRAFIGIKCMHGSKNVIISSNNVSHNDLWGLVMLPGTASHPAEAAKEGAPARPANLTAGNIIANNVFSDFGFGHEYYNWEGSRGGVISLESGQLPDNPIMTDVLIQGNIVYDTGREQILIDGVPTTAPPRYEYAVFISPDPEPKGLRFVNNIFHPGRTGVSNLPLAQEPRIEIPEEDTPR